MTPNPPPPMSERQNEDWDAPPERFRGGGDNDAPLNTSRGILFKWTVWIFGVGGGFALAFAYMIPYLPTGGGSGPAAVTEADFELRSATGTFRDREVTLLAPANQVRQADLDAHLAHAISRMNELASELHGDGGPGGGLAAINQRPGTAIRVSRPFRQAVEITQEVSATVGVSNAFVTLDPNATPPTPQQQGTPADNPADNATPPLDSTNDDQDAAAPADAPPTSEQDDESEEGEETGEHAEDEAAEEADGEAPDEPALPSGPLLAFGDSDVTLLHAGTRLDLGAVADGRIVDTTVAALQDEGLRTFAFTWGDIAFYSGDFGGYPWPVTIESPDGQGRADLFVSGRSVVHRTDGTSASLAAVVIVGGRADRAAGLADILVRREADEALRAADLTVGTDAIAFIRGGGARMTPGMSTYIPAGR